MITRFVYFWILVVFIAGLAVPLGAAVSTSGAELKVEDYIKKPTAEIQGLAVDNDKKGKELFTATKYRDSIPFFERSAFYSKVLIEQAKLRQQELKDEAKRQELAKQEEAKRLELAQKEEARLREQALQRLREAQAEVNNAKQRAGVNK
ncbi:MAG: hypothetical protein LBC99_06355 [Spirochaetota bacterium]|jgi:hypothetical protein|nr:hypothetical protein [Spirochaetota bacterium]